MRGMLCCQRRGNALWLFGVRTDEEFRGKGLASRLMHHAESLPGSFYGSAVRVLMLTTIESNMPMIRILKNRGFTRNRFVYIWPSWTSVREKRQLLAMDAPAPCGIVDMFSGLKETLCDHSLMPDSAIWYRCDTIEHVIEAMRSLQRQRSHNLPFNDDIGHCLPGEYEMWPMPEHEGEEEEEALGTSWLHISQLIESSRVHILKQWKDCVAILVLREDEEGNVCGSIACHEEMGARAAILHACTVQPRCSIFFIDSGDVRFSNEKSFLEIGGSNEYLVFHKFV